MFWRLRATSGRWAAIVAVVLFVAVTGLIGATGAAAAEGDSGVRTVYVEDGTIHAVETDGTVTEFGVEAELVGRARDFDGDGTLEVPFVDGSGTLGTAEPDGNTRTLATDAAASKSAIASGDRDGDGAFEVYYANVSDSNYVYRAEIGGGPPTRVTATSANGISGVGDFDGDGSDELVFAGSSSTIKYEDGGTVHGTGFSSIGSNNGYGLGRVADFDGDGVARVPIVDGSNNPALVSDDGSKTVLDSGYQSAAKSPVGAVDWTGDGGVELLHLNTSGAVKAMALDGTLTTVSGTNGGVMTADGGAGVATTRGVPGPEISDFEASNPANRTVAVSFNADARLETVTVQIDGPDGENATLHRDAFERSGSGPYAYTADYGAESDGEYEAALTEAVGADGNADAENRSATAVVETPAPTVVNASLERVDGQLPAGENATLRVRAAVNRSDGVNLSVGADASAFGAGTVPLTRSNGSWVGTFDVDASGVAGNRTVAVTAENEYGNAHETASDAVFLDTAGPDANVGPDVVVTAGTNVTFDADATTDRSRIARYQWRFGDGETGAGMTDVHSYERPGTYNATLTATDDAGNAATANRTVTVTERDDDADDGTDTGGGNDSNGESAPELSVDSDRLGADAIRYSVSDANVGQAVELDVPVGEHLGRLILVPATDGDFAVTVRVRDEAPSGTPGVTVEPLAYWNVSRHNESAFERATFAFSLPEERLENRDGVTLHRYHDGAWDRFDAAVRATPNGSTEFYAGAPGLSAFALAAEEPRIRTESAAIGDESVNVGETVTPRASLYNAGNETGTETVTLRIDETSVADRRVTVAAGETRTVLFAHAPKRTGEFDVRVGDAAAGTLRVTEPTPDSGDTTTVTDPASPADPTTAPDSGTISTTGSGAQPTEPSVGTSAADATTENDTAAAGANDTTTGAVERRAGVDADVVTSLVGLLALLGGLGTLLLRDRRR